MKAKKYISILLVLLFSIGLILGGCTDDSEQQEEQMPSSQIETQTLIGEFQGLADGHSVEVLIDGESQVYQFFDEVVASTFESMESGTQIQFDVEVDVDSNTKTIIKLYDAPAQG